MEAANFNPAKGDPNTQIDQEDTQELRAATSISSGSLKKGSDRVYKTFKETIEAIDTIKTVSLRSETPVELFDTVKTTSTNLPPLQIAIATEPRNTDTLSQKQQFEAVSTLKISRTPIAFKSAAKQGVITRWQALLLASLLLVLVLHTSNMGFAQFIGPQGWSYVLNGPGNGANNNILGNLNNQLKNNLTPVATGQTKTRLTASQYIDLIIKNMTLDQKIGQLMIVQFLGSDYTLELSSMISQYHVGSILIFAANGNIVSKSQLISLTKQMQSNATLPLAIAIDQEGGTVDRLKLLDGPRPSATSLGNTNDPSQATAAGVQDAKDLASYGINLNLAPVVDVTNIYNPQLYLRTFGNNPTIVTNMAGAYLNGLQKSGQVVGTLKHFPGLGDISCDPHTCVPDLLRSKTDLENIDWAPYRNLIAQGNVYSIMVTHEIVSALDTTKPSSLSSKVVTDILRNEMGFQGVVMTDSLTMDSLRAYASEAQAGVMAIQAGDDLLMGASTASEVAAMAEAIKQAIILGDLTQQRIDTSVHRVLMMKYQMGLLPIPTN